MVKVKLSENLKWAQDISLYRGSEAWPSQQSRGFLKGVHHTLSVSFDCWVLRIYLDLPHVKLLLRTLQFQLSSIGAELHNCSNHRTLLWAKPAFHLDWRSLCRVHDLYWSQGWYDKGFFVWPKMGTSCEFFNSKSVKLWHNLRFRIILK